MLFSADRAGVVMVALVVSIACSNSKAGDATDARSGAPAADPAVSRADRTFVENAVASGELEVEHAKLAEAQASNPAVKAFATHLITAHTAANQELAALMERKQIARTERPQPDERRGSVGARNDATTTTKTDAPPTGKPSPTGTTGALGTVETTGEAIDRARAGMTAPWMQATGAAFDEGFVTGQIKAHQDAIALFDQHASIGSDPELKAFAAKQLPQLRDHLRQAQELQPAPRQ